MKVSRLQAIGLMVGLFVLAFFLRAYRPVSRPDHWLHRAEDFYRALDEGDWSGTRLSRHPGATTMAISGLTLRLYEETTGTPAEALFDWAVPPYATEDGRRMVAAQMGLALVIGGLLVGITLALRTLAGWTVAVLAAGLMIFDPFYLAQSRVVHVDALLSVFMLLSALLLLVSLETGQRRYLLLSGLVGGLAQLTKLPSLFLIPFMGLSLLVYLLARLRPAWHDDHPQGHARWLLAEAWQGVALPGLVWLVIAAIPYAFWPAMWDSPFKTVGRIPDATNHYVTSPHIHRFFMGERLYREDPGIFFYAVTLPFLMTFVTLTASLVALAYYTLWRKRAQLPASSLVFWLLAAYVFFFTLQMSLGAKKADRYIGPAHLAIIPMAAIGINGLVGTLQRAISERWSRFAQALPVLLVGVVIALQALIALPFTPDYGAHHNYLLGGNPVASQFVDFMSQNEGIAPVAAYLNRQPQPQQLNIGVTYPVDTSFAQYFGGEIRRGMSAHNDFHLFNYVDMQRRIWPDQWQPALEAYQDGPPQMIVIYDRVAFMRLYVTRPSGPFEQVVIRRGGVGFVWLAWGWTALVLALLVYTFTRRTTTI